jgi:hypothetical protein
MKLRLLFVGILVLAACLPASAQTIATTTAVETSHIVCSTVPCEVFGGQVNNTNAAARWVMLLDAAAVPTAGGAAVVGCANAAAARPCVLKWYQIGANSTIGLAAFFIGQPLPFKSGFVAICSSTGPFTYTAASDCAFSFEVQQ